MPVPEPRLAARSAGAIVDVALLRAARTDLAEPDGVSRITLADRLRGFATFRPPRPSGVGTLVAGRASREA